MLNLKKKECKTSIRKMKEPISDENLFEYFGKQIEWNQEAVAVQIPYSQAQIFLMVYANIKKCGLCQDDFREWSRKKQRDTTWKTSWLTLLETQRSSKTSKTKHYAAHVHAAQANLALFAKMQQDHTLALVNLAIATQSDRK